MPDLPDVCHRLANPVGKGQGDIDAAVRQVIDAALDAGRYNLFAAAELDSVRLDVLSDDFLQRVSAIEQRNPASKTLRKLLNDQVRNTERKNLSENPDLTFGGRLRKVHRVLFLVHPRSR
jgi:hypothetical protein